MGLVGAAVRKISASVNYQNDEHPLVVELDSKNVPVKLHLAEPARADLVLQERVEQLCLLIRHEGGWGAISVLSDPSPRFSPIIDRITEKLAALAPVEGDDE